MMCAHLCKAHLWRGAAIAACAFAALLASANAQPIPAPNALAATQLTAQAPLATQAPALALNARELPLGGKLRSAQHWQAYKARFVTEQGRVVDSGNGLISHSEGQGYGMLLAVAANDRQAFDRIWGWTRANLMVRNDELIAWRWEPGQRPAVSDLNNASDGDILVAWALTEAAEHWAELSYRVAARRIAVEVGRKLVLFKTQYGALLLPGISGFAARDRADGPVINLSYYVFPAFARLKIVASEYDWKGLTQSGLDLLKKSAGPDHRLPSDWSSIKDGELKPASGFPPLFAYNAVRIPLYLAWAGIGEREHYAPFFNWAQNKTGMLSLVDVTTGVRSEVFREPGYRAIAQILQCVVEGGKLNADFNHVRDGQNYYPATLHLLALVATEMRYASCISG